MAHRSLRLPDSLDEDLEAEAEELDLTTSEYIREILRDRDPPEQRDEEAPTVGDVLDRLDELEQRVADVEGRLDEPGQQPRRREPPATGDRTDEESPTETVESDSGRESGERSLPAEYDDVVEAVLEDWEYGRTDEERAANHDLAVQALEWLRTYDGEAEKSDVPLDELADADPQDRSTDTLWTQLVREVWKHAAEKGVVEQPNYRTYEWVG